MSSIFGSVFFFTLVVYEAVADISSRGRTCNSSCFRVTYTMWVTAGDRHHVMQTPHSSVHASYGVFPSFFSLGLQQSTIPSICRESRNNKMSRTRLDMEPRITSFFQRCADAQVDLIEWDHPLLARLNYPLVVDKASGTSFLICPRIADKN